MRDIILGAGDSPDRSVAVDALDTLELAADRASAAGRRAMFGELLDLFGDPDPATRTGAVIGLEAVRDAWDAERLVAALDLHASELAAAPIGFPAVHRALADEVLVRAAAVVRPAQAHALARLTAAADDEGLRPWVVANLAASVPGIVVANARRWGRAGEPGPLFRLQAHAHRCAFAAALAPWPAAAIERVRRGPWAPTERAELEAAMTGPGPPLTAQV